MTRQRPIDDCFFHDRDRMRHDDALTLLRERLIPVVSSEEIALSHALGRILNKDIIAPHDVPLHTNAAVDGFAFAGSVRDRRDLKVSMTIAAGDLSPASLPQNHAARIFTGATMPEGADTVAMQEDCETQNGTVTIPDDLPMGANCRKAGEDLHAGDCALKAGTRLIAADLAAAASIGKANLPVYGKLTVTCFSSGDEMRRVGDTTTPLQRGEVFDANWPLLSALLAPLPVNVSDGGILGDDLDATREAIEKAARSSDVILTTGGASRGAEDHMLAVLDDLGKRHLWQLAVKPGRPMMFGQIARVSTRQDCLYFGLPGNPVAAMICFLLYTRPALLRLAGANWTTPPRFKVPAAFGIDKKKPDRREFLRGILSTDEDGTLTVRKFARDGSGLISSLREADGLIELPEEMTRLETGTPVDFIPFSSFD